MTTNTGATTKNEAIRKLIVFACFLVTAVTLIPVVMMVLVAFQSDAESMAATPSFWPTSWHPENLERAFALVPLGRYLLNTVIFAAGTTLLETATAALATLADVEGPGPVIVSLLLWAGLLGLAGYRVARRDMA